MKEGGGGDHLSIGVSYPDGKYDRPISKNLFLSPGENATMSLESTGDRWDKRAARYH